MLYFIMSFDILKISLWDEFFRLGNKKKHLTELGVKSMESMDPWKKKFSFPVLHKKNKVLKNSASGYSYCALYLDSYVL